MLSVLKRVAKLLDGTYDKMLENRSSNGSSVGEANGDSLSYHSYYIDRFPLTAQDFSGWQGSQHRLQDVVRDRENHHLYDTVMGCFASYGAEGVGDYHEYGICGAGQFRVALSKAKKWGLDKMNFYAFDSFEGLPTDGSLAMSEEAFWTSVRGQGVNVDKVTTTAGFFDQSLTEDLQKQFIAKGRPVDFVNIDCDLHESALPVFKFISPLLRPGSVIYLDDFYSTFKAGEAWGTARAFFDFAKNHPTLGFYPFVRAGFWGLSFKAYDRKLFDFPMF
jgi:hypothetical protein